MQGRGALAAIALLSGCGPALDGFLWRVTLTGAVDECNDPPVPYQQSFDYILGFSGGDVTLSLEDEPFASGRLSGCTIDYASVIWSELRGDAEVRWRIEGSAQYRQGGQTCNLDAGVDWLGHETFVVVSSEDPAIPAGCRYILDASGTYGGEL